MMSSIILSAQKPKAVKDYDEDDKEFLKKKKASVCTKFEIRLFLLRKRSLTCFLGLQEEEAALKKAREALLKGKKK